MTRRLLRILCPLLLLLCSAPLESAVAAFTLTTAYTVRDHLGSTRAVVGREQLKQA